MTRIVVFFRNLLDAFRHVRTGGRTTRRRARAKAAAPPKKCPTCRQPVPHSLDWRDHVDIDEHHCPTEPGASPAAYVGTTPVVWGRDDRGRS